MPHRFVRAEPGDDLDELYERVDAGEIEKLDPFGTAMTESLSRARFDPATGEAVWVEEDYCSPPLAMEREEVLDDYFERVDVLDDDVDPETAWDRIDELPSLREHLVEEA